jgi:hypothetical protein
MVCACFKSEERIPRKVFNVKIKGKCSRGSLRSKWEQKVKKDVTQMEGKPWEETQEEEMWKDR